MAAGASSSARYVDTATDCAICLSPLSSEPIITLSCGHKWHLRCIKEQLMHAVPNPGKRLMFSGCRCAKCGEFCDHEELQSPEYHGTLELRVQVDKLILDQINVDGLYNKKAVTDKSSVYYNDAFGYGRSLYAFYMCGVCSKPYFGGNIECADRMDELLETQDRCCPNCNPASSSILCSDTTHIGFYEWKCRYCCKVASHVCYGNTHFCDDCHDRDAIRLAGRNSANVKLLPIPCLGMDNCTTVMRAGQTHHKNGPSYNCEQVLRCTLCSTDPLGIGVHNDDANVSHNLVYNGNAQHGRAGWTGGNPMWEIEESGVQFRDERANFVSSFRWARMAQAIDLRKFLIRPDAARLQVSARYMGRTDCPSVFKLCTALYDSNMREITFLESEELTAPADFWEPVSIIIPPSNRAAYVVVGVQGKDTRFWAGNFGSKVTDISVKVLFDGSNASRAEIMGVEEEEIIVDNFRADRNLLVKFFQRWTGNYW